MTAEPRATPPTLQLIVAHAARNAIGRTGELPWDAPEDLHHFRATTLDHTIIIGATTWESIGRPLPRRHIIVVTTRTFNVPQGVELAHSPQAAVDTAFTRDPEPFVAGGTKIYEQLLPQVTRIHLTNIAADVPDADAFFPTLQPEEWTTIESHSGTDTRLTFSILERVTPT